MDEPISPNVYLNYTNVALAFSFIVFDAILSFSFKLGVGRSLIIAAIRCVLQLAVVGAILQQVFATESPWLVAGYALLLNFLGTFETVVNKSKKSYDYMFPSVFIAFLCSTIPVAVVGTRFAMSLQPFWKPTQFIPVVGMLAGNTISGIVVSITYVLKELDENKDKVEMYLAFGASRFEACKPIASDALRLALTPIINQMSVMGIISIPGMMTGAILGGSPVDQAAKLQMVIMFMIGASAALGSIVTTLYALSVGVDSEGRLRVEKVRGGFGGVSGLVSSGWKWVRGWRAHPSRDA